jgi:hypothetical protein
VHPSSATCTSHCPYAHKIPNCDTYRLDLKRKRSGRQSSRAKKPLVKKQLPKSIWAQKFGAQKYGSTISGYTPVKPTIPGIPSQENCGRASQAVSETIREQYQRHGLNDFTTQELVDLDAISSRRLRPSDLKGPIISFLTRDHWYNGREVGEKVIRIYPLTDERFFGHRWVGSSDIVWEILQPSLLIATKMYETQRLKSSVSYLSLSGQNLLTCDTGRSTYMGSTRAYKSWQSTTMHK